MNFKNPIPYVCLAMMATSLSACGGTDKETTIVHDRPVVQQNSNSMTPDQVESTCKHGYDNSSHSCY